MLLCQDVYTANITTHRPSYIIMFIVELYELLNYCLIHKHCFVVFVCYTNETFKEEIVDVDLPSNHSKNHGKFSFSVMLKHITLVKLFSPRNKLLLVNLGKVNTQKCITVYHDLVT